MIRTIENDRLRIAVSDAGAELVSIYDKTNEREILWQADPAYWKRHAPILFPNVGRHCGNHYRINGQEYASSQHGFARDSEFACIDSTAASITHKLKASASTKASYPFDFSLSIKHVLSGSKVLIHWKVENTGEQPMYFTIGGHPAFRIPVLENTEYTDYSLHFSGRDALQYLLLDPASGTVVPDKVYALELNEGSCSLDTHMFDNDALIFDDGQISKAGILLPDGSPYLELSCEGFPNFGIWSVPGAPFVCLEPWVGRTDNCGFKGELSEKPGITALQPDEIFEKSYYIHIF